MAAKEFIVGGVDSKWSTSGNWNPSGKPANGDTVTVNAAVTAMEIDEDTARVSIDFSGAGAGLVVSGSGGVYNAGDLTLKSGSTWTHTGRFSTASSGGTSRTWTFNGVSISSVQYVTIGWSYSITLGSDLNCGTKSLNVLGTGSLTTSNYSITCGNFNDAGVTGATTLTLGSSTINCTNVSFAAATLTVSSNTATINVTTSTGGDTTMALNNVAWGATGDATNLTDFVIVAGTGRTLTTTGSAEVGNWNISWSADALGNEWRLTGSPLTIHGTLTITGAADTRCPRIISSTNGTQKTIHPSAITLTASKYVLIRDINMDTAHNSGSDWDFSSIGSGNAGGNDGITFRAADDLYLDAGTTNTVYYYSAVWATSSGGGATAGLFPLPQDNIIIDNNSWDDTGNEIQFNSFLGGIDASALTENNTLYFGVSYLYGNLDLSGSGYTVRNVGGIYLYPRLKNEASAIQTVKISPSTWGSGTGGLIIGLYNGEPGTVRLDGAVTLGNGGTATLTAASLDLNGNTLTCGIFSSTNSNTRELKDSAGGGGIILTGLTGTLFDTTTATNLTVNNAPDIQIGTGALTLTANITFMGTAKTYGDFTVKKHAGNFDCIITGSNTFGALTLETPDATYQYSDLQLTESTTTAVTSLVLDGHADYKPNLLSTTATHATISDSSGTNTVTNCLITAVNAAGGASFILGTGASIADDETGWTGLASFIQSIMRHRTIPDFLGGLNHG